MRTQFPSSSHSVNVWTHSCTLALCHDASLVLPALSLPTTYPDRPESGVTWQFDGSKLLPSVWRHVVFIWSSGDTGFMISFHVAVKTSAQADFSRTRGRRRTLTEISVTRMWNDPRVLLAPTSGKTDAPPWWQHPCGWLFVDGGSGEGRRTRLVAPLSPGNWIQPLALWCVTARISHPYCPHRKSDNISSPSLSNTPLVLTPIPKSWTIVTSAGSSVQGVWGCHPHLSTIPFIIPLLPLEFLVVATTESFSSWLSDWLRS